MDVRETTLQELLGGPKQYLVPLYQRPYAWEGRQRSRLWDDILELAETRRTSPSATHFMGSLVLSAGAIVPSGMEFLVVDGQQRLTTLSILLCALRDYTRIHEPDQPLLAESIHEQYIADRFKPGDARLKLLPTQADRGPYRAVVDSAVGADSLSGVGDAYGFFRRELELADDPDDPHDIARIQDAVLTGLTFVSITARDHDNVYRIFESLNNTGLRLTQGDLVRNYLFMRLGSRGESVYSSWWLPMQERLSAGDLELIFWLDAVADQPLLKQTDIYTYQQSRLSAMSDAEIDAEIIRFAKLSELLAVIRDPSGERDPAVRRHLQHLAEWGSTTTVPLTLRLLARRAAGSSSSEEIAGALAAVESFIVRRTLGGRAGEGINRTILQACGELDDRPVDLTILDYLSTGRKYFSTDARIRESARSDPFYLRGRRTQQKLILKWIQERLNPKEPVDVTKATIEHVLPQTLTPEWRSVLATDLQEGETVEEVHEQLVHTVGNLTLTGYNSELSNRPFEDKKIALATSSFGALNQAIVEQPTWGRAQILARSDWMAEQVLAQWQPPSERVDVVETGIQWPVVHQAIMAIPAGRWTSYGDLAALIGTHPVPLGQHIAGTKIPGAHRVLQASGAISGGFRWFSSADERSPQSVLEEEGVRFTPSGTAYPAQRLTTEDLAARIGLVVDGDIEENSFDGGSFLEQLARANPPEIVHGVVEVLRRWEELGGAVEYGSAQETSAFLAYGNLWPMAIYPLSGRIEVVFEYLRRRPPFDSAALREELRQRLNRARGIDLAADRLERRPSFPVEVLAGSDARALVVDALQWVAAVTAGAQPDVVAVGS